MTTRHNHTARIYLSGPMTGLPDYNHPAFHAEAARLRALGYKVANPAETNAADIRSPALATPVSSDAA